jgi:A/G-specific adenine glycosylase
MTDFHRLIVEWYRLNKRDLPWRETQNAYFIWLSEIILQQTRVLQGMNYYLKFIRHYPTVHDLANASEQDVLNDWQGLGYYSRARNLHFTAKLISKEMNGVFPSSFDEIKKLKGIGDYTAAAISSFAYNLPHAVVDGNVYRVLSRVFEVRFPIDSTDGKKYFAELAQELISLQEPAVHNQAIMELGAMQCLPVNPICDSCPLNSICLAFSNQSYKDLPVKAKKNKTRNRYFHFLIFKKSGSILLEKREEKDIWQHLFQFPLIETARDEELTALSFSKLGVLPYRITEGVKHVLSHQRIYARFYYFDGFPVIIEKNYFQVAQINIQDYPLPRLIDRFLDEQGI